MVAELLFSLLLAVGVLDSRTEDEVRPDLRPAYSDVVCYVECLEVCLWSGPPATGQVTP
jgi:hypothetical protein